MIRVGLARAPASYAGLTPPYHPGKAYPELAESRVMPACAVAHSMSAAVIAGTLSRPVRQIPITRCPRMCEPSGKKSTKPR